MYSVNLANTSAKAKVITHVVCTIILFTEYLFSKIKIKLNVKSFP